MLLKILLFLLLALLPIAALAIALIALHWRAWAEAQAKVFDSSLDHITEE